MRQTRLLVGLAIAAFAFALAGRAEERLQLTVARAEPGFDPRAPERPNIGIFLNESSRDAFGKWTASHVGEKMRISIDGHVVGEPRLLSPLTGGVLQIVIEGVSKDENVGLSHKLQSGEARLSVASDE